MFSSTLIDLMRFGLCTRKAVVGLFSTNFQARPVRKLLTEAMTGVTAKDFKRTFSNLPNGLESVQPKRDLDK